MPADDTIRSTGGPNRAAQLGKLGITLDPDIPYRLETMFPRVEGWGVKGELKKKGKIIRQVESRLKSMLRPDEEVFYIAKGTQYSFAEQYFMGIWAMTINQTVFVLTNVRLLMLRTNGSGKPKETFWMIYYSQIDKFQASWTGMLTLKLDDGKKLQFSGFPKSDRKTMPAVFEQALEKYRELGFDPEASQSLECLCNHCHSIVAKNEFECEKCGAEFWKPSAVALRSLVFPSWGDIVMKHYVVGAVEFIGYCFTWFIVLSLIAGEAGNGNPGALVVAIAIGLILLGIAHGADAALTYFVARKGLHPRRGPKRDADVEFVEA
jgi:hypothetical protein